MKNFFQGVLAGILVLIVGSILDGGGNNFPLIWTDFIGILIFCNGRICEDMGALIHFVTLPISYGFVFVVSSMIINRYTKRPNISPSQLAQIQSHLFLLKMLISLIFTFTFFVLFSDIESVLEFFL